MQQLEDHACQGQPESKSANTLGEGTDRFAAIGGIPSVNDTGDAQGYRSRRHQEQILPATQQLGDQANDSQRV